MAQTQRRMVYSKIWTSEQFGKLSDKAKLLFIGSITLADDDGRLRANPAYLRGLIFPYDENITVTEVLQLRNEIETSGLFFVYKVEVGVENSEIIQHPKWEEYQIIRKDLYKESQFPSPEIPLLNRNETVTKTLQKSTLSKDKKSKVKIRKEKRESTPELSAPTPSQEAIDFFAKGENYSKTVTWLKEKGMDEKVVVQELTRFIVYWTERNKTGKKERWEMERTFEVRRRLATWLSRARDFSGFGFKKQDTQQVDKF